MPIERPYSQDSALVCLGECRDLDGREVCGASSPYEPGQWAFACTRKHGHDGDHVACGGRHEIKIWPQSQQPSSLKDNT